MPSFVCIMNNVQTCKTIPSKSDHGQIWTLDGLTEPQKTVIIPIVNV